MKSGTILVKFSLLCALVTLGLGQGAVAAIYQLEVGIDGVACSTCGYQLQKKISKLKFVKQARVSMASAKALIDIDESKPFSINEFDKAIIESGFSLRYSKAKVKGKLIAANYGYVIKDKVNSVVVTNGSRLGSGVYVNFLGKVIRGGTMQKVEYEKAI